MSHTQFRDDHTSVVPNRAMAYDPKEHADGYVFDVSYFEQTGDGAVHTTVEDLQKWDENFFSAQIGGKDFLKEIQEQGKLNSGKVLDYAKGLFIEDYRGLHTVSHGGAWGGYRAELLRFPEQHFSVACLCNLGTENPSNRAHRVADIYLASLLKPKPEKKKEEENRKKKDSIKLTENQLQAFAGDYWSEELGVTYQLGVADGKLKVLKIMDAAGFPRFNASPQDGLRATGMDEFEAVGTPAMLHFKRGDQGAVNQFILDAGRTEGMIFVRRDRQPI
jgi:hypothetical protein